MEEVLTQKPNDRQKEAIGTLDKNILLLAPAGTGKTNTLAGRVANILLQKQALPEEILCLTFTNKACREMQARIIEKIGLAGKKVVVKTFHGFCYDVIKNETKRKLDVFADFTIFDETDCQGLIEEVTDKFQSKALQNLIVQLKEKRAEYALFSDDSEADYTKALEKLIAEDSASLCKECNSYFKFDKQLFNYWQQHGAKITANYDKRLHELHGLDFTDLITNVYQLFQQPAVAKRWTERFAFINIDEVQDTSRLEYDIISQIFGNSYLLLCGDYFQTIYEWRGSDPVYILKKYEREYSPLRIVLYENYRSTQVLLNASFACLKHLFPDLVATLYPDGMQAASKEIGQPITLKGAMYVSEEAQWIYNTIQKLPEKNYSRICILTRNNRYNKVLSDNFASLSYLLPAAQRIPFMIIEEAKFYRRQEIKDALAFLKLIVNKHDEASLIRILNRFGKGIGPMKIKQITANEYRDAGIRLTDFIDGNAISHGDPFTLLTCELAKDNVVVFDVEATGVDTTSDEIIQIAGVRLNKDGQVKAEFNRLLKPTKSVGDSEAVHGFSDEYLQENGEDPAKVLSDFCAFAKGAVIVWHNVSYDLSILASQLGRLKLPELFYLEYYDTLDIFRRFYPNLPNHKLEYLGKFCQVKHESSHDAFDDILATAEILLYALKQKIEPQAAKRRMLMQKWWDVFAPLAAKIKEFRQVAYKIRLADLLVEIVLKGGLQAYYQKETKRMENLRNLFRNTKAMDDINMSPKDMITHFLRYTTLSNTELDLLLQKQQIPIITVHQAKGSEFDYVFLAGLQENDFPIFNAEENGCLAEEARLFYVAITRAKKKLFLSWCQNNNGRYRRMSRFLKSIPREYIDNV